MNSPTLPDRDHIWVRGRLAPAAAGLLSDADEERLQTHLARCADCAEAWQEQIQALVGEDAEADPDGQRHLPPAMVARWEQATQVLQGREREAVRSHLERCASCRADLEALGHLPRLPVAPLAMRPVTSRRSFGSGLAWGAGVTALAAMVAGLILMPTRTAEPENSLLPWVAVVTMRGDSPAELDLAPDDTSFSILATIPADLDAERPATVTVFDPTGRNLFTSEVPPRMPNARTISIVIREEQSITVGQYRVVFAQLVANGSPRSWESAFQVNLR